ncbi:phage holin family protein [Nocardia cyriacigeorgica]|jgi:putative membrane protein|uniref:phage holin family protein n=1 Tax=Nocardia cyriacigeorgica TaxID=135487 RepID=UPI00055D86AE|nr:phage holin family protein [Nocardia cyriacigeorgica]AVH21994.1 phage holin family protein [Nocardia cyriacigeorgica]MBF6085498.1 phage holin family protein [Nocardia cyriacigeorgica]MBF6091586.1 phage holin family protein [Nocardia cyriacigeorgica]MBF6321530.1 phage holin family protein [Nocardia cyriacigeorgica]MBF6394778.1 phage holin family protein [Nocardia cyriacigeorgica]
MQLVLRLVINAFAIWLAATWIDKIDIISPEDQGNGAKIVTLLAVAAVFTAVNALVKPIVQLLSLPLVIVTLGLFLLVVNALMLWLTAWITEFTDYGLRIDGFWAAFWGAIIVTVVNWLLGVLVPDRD